MDWNKSICLVTLMSLMVMAISGCTEYGESVPSTGEQTARPEGWTEETHGSNVDPNYEIVFPQDKVNQIAGMKQSLHQFLQPVLQ